MNEGILASFQHPKIKVAKIKISSSKDDSKETINVPIKKKEETKKKEDKKTIEHKFKVI